MQIYGKLRQLRKANHLSQEELALKLNEYVTKWICKN